MNALLCRLWNEEDGFVLSSEVMMYGTLGVVGLGTGLAALRDSVNSELDDVAKAIGSMDQSYGIGGTCGHSAWTAGSAFYDRADFCDMPKPQVVHERPLVCADVFGPGPGHLSQPVPFGVAPLPGPRSLPGPAAEPPKMRKGEAPATSKSVRIEDPAPAVVAGSKGLAPLQAPIAGAPPVRVMVNPWQAGPYMIDVPEGYFNHPPGMWAQPPYYQMFVHGPHGYHDYGYNYGPAHPGVVRAGSGAETIDLGFAKVTDAELKEIEEFDTAKCLHVLGSNVTDKGLGYICAMDQLESLHLVGTQITDGGLKQLRELKKLRFLHLVGTRITDAGLPALAACKHLEVLDVRGTPVTDAGLAGLVKELPTLRVVR